MSVDPSTGDQDEGVKRDERGDQRKEHVNDSLRRLILEERKRLARDLHDSVNQKLFSLSLIARGLSHQLAAEDENVKQGIRDIGLLAQDTLADLRNLIWQLQPIDTEQDFLELLREYGEKIGLHIFIECYGEEVDVTESVVEGMLRFGQEALNNVRKHSGLNQAFIRFDISHEQLQLRIIDHGRGFEVGLVQNRYSSFGIRNMKERAAQIGGKVTICSSPGNGTTVTLVAPVQEGRESIGH